MTARLLAFLALVVVAGSAHAQTYPAREIRILIGFTAGGTTDILGRLIANEMSKSFGVPVIIDNRPGATGNIAAEMTARAKPDGYTLMIGSVGPLASNPTLFPNSKYDNLRDFAPITLIAEVPNILVVNPRLLTVATLKEYLDAIRASPGRHFYASTGAGTTSHLTGELLRMTAGLDMVHVPYKGAGGVTDLLAGDQICCMYATAPSVIQHVRSGKLKAIAVTSKFRSKATPDLPTFDEAGLPGFEASTWYGMVAPAGLPPEIADKLQKEIARILGEPAMHEKFMQQGADPVASSPAEFGVYMRAETEKWAKVIKAGNVKAD